MRSLIIENTPNEDDAKWRRKSETTSWICIVYALMVGMEYSSTITSLFFYLKYNVPVENDQIKMWYTFIMCVTALSAAINGVLAGKIFDRTRKLKAAMLILTKCTLFGYLLYACNMSVWFLVFGRFLCGICDASQPVISGNSIFIYFYYP